ncbi:DUF2065 domain-containing protein [Devosia sp.]|uniref:DUF2065 domain-containing protein n=1 Tax=Devosia sp. TaxID=1871048 RepID=UPI00326577F5
MTDLFAAFALAIVLEGLLYAAFPDKMKQYLTMLVALPAARIRLFALILAGVGLVLLWAIRG